MRFRPVYVEGTTLGDTWFNLLYQLYHQGRSYLVTDGSYAGIHRLAFDDVSGFIHHPHVKPLAPIMPESTVLKPPTTEDTIDSYFATYLMDSELAPREDYRYATWIAGGDYVIPRIKVWTAPVMWEGVIVTVPNQIQWIIDHFKKKGFGNEHCYLTVGYPESNFAYDVPYSNPNERRTSPCLRGLDFRVVDGALLLKVVYRSWDLWGGFPTNMGGFTRLNEYVASELGIEPGPLSFTCKSLHCYQFQMRVLAESTHREELKLTEDEVEELLLLDIPEDMRAV